MLDDDEDDEDGFIKFKDLYYKLTGIIRNICNNNWDFLNDLQKNESDK